CDVPWNGGALPRGCCGAWIDRGPPTTWTMDDVAGARVGTWIAGDSRMAALRAGGRRRRREFPDCWRNLVALLGTLAWRQRLPPAHRARRLSTGAAVALAAVVVAMPSLRGQEGSVEPIRSRAETREWQSFDETSLQRMVAAGKIVLDD